MHCQPTKFTGSAKATIDYYAETNEMAAGITGYYGLNRGDVVFSHVRGSLADHFGLDGIATKSVFARIHAGRDPNTGVQLVRKGMAPVPERDGRGCPIKVMNDETERLETIYKMVQATTPLTPAMRAAGRTEGNPVFDKVTGEPVMKRLMERAHVSGYNVRFAFDKSVSELLIAYRDDPDVGRIVRQAAFDAVDAAMANLVEGQMRLVDVGKGKPLEPADKIMWMTTLGMSSRPTPEARRRLYEVDPHFVADCFMPAMVMKDAKMRKIDGHHLMKGAKTLGQAVNVEFNRILENHGIKVTYSKPNLKGEIRSRIEGSSTVVREYFSTNQKLVRQIADGFEHANNRPPIRQEIEAIQKNMRGAKTRTAKIGDQVGNRAKLDEWAEALEREGLKLTIAPLQESIERAPWVDRHTELISRLESDIGIAVGLDKEAVFGPETVMPAVYRLADGLGFSPQELVDIGEDYRNNYLLVRIEADDPSAVLYTTPTILSNEREIATRLDRKANKIELLHPGKGVRPEYLRTSVARAGFKLDLEQFAFVTEAVSAKRVVHCIGRAGSGKSNSTKAIVHVMREAGAADQIAVVAVARKRSEELAAELNADRKGSIDSIVRQVLRGQFRPTKDTVVILDEAALVNTFQMTELLRAIGPAKLITLSDNKQATAIGIAGWLEKELAKRPATELVNVYRHKNEADLAAFEDFRAGRAAQGVANLDSRNRIHIASTHGRMLQQVRDGYKHYREQGYEDHEIVIVHQGSNHDLDAMNRMIQRLRMRNGEISNDDKLAVVEESTGREWTLHKGDRIIITKGLYKGLSKPVFNGDMGVIKEIRPYGVRVKLDKDGSVITIPVQHTMDVQPIALANCVSTMKYQGSSIKVDLVIPGKPGITSANSLYSAVTRTIDHCEVFLDNERWGKDPITKLSEVASVHETKVEASYYFDRMNEIEEELELDLGPDVEIDEEFVLDDLRPYVERGRDQGQEFGV